MSFLQLKNVVFRYPHHDEPALQNINLTIDEQTINVIIGPNGSGKTTLLHLILGLDSYQGTILLNNQPIKQKKYQIGYLPQRFNTDKHIPITAKELLWLALAKCHHHHRQQEKMVKEALEKVQANRFANEQVKDLSGGQLQRVLLARAIVHNPDLLLLDEPEAGVDPGGEQVFYQLIKNLVTSSEVTALIASHEISLVREYADQVICLNKTITCAGDPEETLTSQNLEELYQESVQMLDHHH